MKIIKMNENQPSTNPEKILVIRNDHIGDLVLSTSVFRELRKKYPQSRIVAVVSNSNKSLIEKNKDINEFIVINHGRDFFKNFFKNLPNLRKIRKENFNIGIDLRGDFVNSLLMFITKIKYKLSFYQGPLSNIFLNFKHKRDGNKHESFNMLDIINNGLNMSLKDNWPDISTDSSDKKELDEFISKNNLKKFVCISPESNQPNMQWSLEEFDKVIKFIKNNYKDYKIVLLGVDNEKLDYLSERNPGIINLRKANLRMVYLLFKKSNLVVSLDTGTMHLAWAGNSNLLCILMPVSEPTINHTMPLGKNSRHITGEGQIPKAERVNEEIERILDKSSLSKNLKKPKLS